MKNHIVEYKKKLEKGICDYMSNPVTERSSEAIKNMVKCWLRLSEMEKEMCWSYDFTKEDAEKWNSVMMNDDGTKGGHWTVEQTTAVAKDMGVKFDHITEYCWNVTMNMMYSDYCTVAERFGISTPEFYSDMAQAFLFDKDGGDPKSKLSGYYHCIVEK